MAKRDSIIDKFATDVCEFIYTNDLEDKSNNLVLDYIESLYSKGIDLTKRDVEQEIYIFYNYFNKYEDLLNELGEDKFIDIITDAELERQIA